MMLSVHRSEARAAAGLIVVGVMVVSGCLGGGYGLQGLAIVVFSGPNDFINITHIVAPEDAGSMTNDIFSLTVDVLGTNLSLHVNFNCSKNILRVNISGNRGYPQLRINKPVEGHPYVVLICFGINSTNPRIGSIRFFNNTNEIYLSLTPSASELEVEKLTPAENVTLIPRGLNCLVRIFDDFTIKMLSLRYYAD